VIVAIESHQGAFDMQVTTIGLDIAKNVFQVHGIDAAEKVVVRKQLRRSQVLEFFKTLLPCLVGMEACATAHYWARELMRLGHQVRLMPAKDVKAYVKRTKTTLLTPRRSARRYDVRPCVLCRSSRPSSRAS
jgi:transposase